MVTECFLATVTCTRGSGGRTCLTATKIHLHGQVLRKFCVRRRSSKDDSFHGQGRMVFASGYKYYGQWEGRVALEVVLCGCSCWDLGVDRGWV